MCGMCRAVYSQTRDNCASVGGTVPFFSVINAAATTTTATITTTNATIFSSFRKNCDCVWLRKLVPGSKELPY